MRAFYVTARRSEGIANVVIAVEIGDRTSAKIIVDLYGDLSPNWIDTKEGKIGFMPEGNDKKTGSGGFSAENLVPLPVANVA